MEKLTQRQQQVLDIVREYIDRTGYPPTRADIAQALGFKSANAPMTKSEVPAHMWARS